MFYAIKNDGLIFIGVHIKHFIRVISNNFVRPITLATYICYDKCSFIGE